MALLPYSLRPSVIIRRKAIRQGILGPSRMWKAVAVWVFGKKTLKKFFGKNPEVITTEKVGSNSFVNVINAKPMTKKELKEAGITKPLLISRASADVASSWATKVAEKPKRKTRRRAEKTARMAAEAQARLDKQTAKAVRKAAKRAS